MTKEIPKIIHRYWHQNSGPGYNYERMQIVCGETVYAHHGDILNGNQWDIRFIDPGEANFPTHLIDQELFSKMTNPTTAADYIRYILLYHYGGWWVDTDVYFLKSLESLTHIAQDGKYTFIAGYEDTIYINNAVLGSVPEHPIIKYCLDVFPVAMQRPSPSYTGPKLLTEAIHFHTQDKQDPHLMLVPRQSFYPLHWADVLEETDNVDNGDFSELTRQRFPHSYAVHLYDGIRRWKRAQVREEVGY